MCDDSGLAPRTVQIPKIIHNNNVDMYLIIYNLLLLPLTSNKKLEIMGALYNLLLSFEW